MTAPPRPGWSRTEAAEKLTGRARYAADRPVDTHAVLVTSTIPAGRVREVRLDTARFPGVRVLTHADAPRLRDPDEGGRIAEGKVPVYVQRVLPLQDDRVHYEGQPVALVLADRAETAHEAAAALRVEYDPEPAVLPADADEADARPARDWLVPSSSAVGDLDAGVAEAHTVLERTYTTAARHHSPIEPAATVAAWDGGRLTLYDATQSLFAVRATVAAVLGLPEDGVRVVAEHVGGGFGSKGYVWPHVLLAAMAARLLGGTVALVLTRAQSFTAHGFQPETRQSVLLAARADGRLTAVRHLSTNLTARYAEYPEFSAIGTRTLYASPAIETRTRVLPVDLGLPTPMRSPHEGTGMFALESAMDELAYALGVDPLELRLRNHAEQDPTERRPFSSKELRACYEEGARRFGWDRRPMAPRSLRDGRELVGQGMASVILHSVRLPATARITMEPDGGVVLAAGTQEIGGGTRTIMPQIAAETLGVPRDRITFRMGDTSLPANLYSVGSSTANSLGSAVRKAALALRERLGPGARPPAEPLTVQETWLPAPGDRSVHSFGAVFVEVGVDEDLGVTRVRRVVGVYSAGRIINPVTARSQLTGGLVWGIGQALLEESAVDPRLGRFVSKNLAGFLVPVQADIPDLDVSFVDEYDPHAGALGGRGIGELAPIGVAAAVANAVHHATGIRLRSLPLRTVEALTTTPA
ncbi:xanthine dehydrogenase family protein molybdopterin-binding subunit [Streptomyces sp. NPDC006134]|uniref:xanthine dehydrogenase family protein molybdopterin-binding subunit n=1 Tax=Streptomyces sp. NPDC006134 TaxID=3154467 RepID=UPI00340897CA